MVVTVRHPRLPLGRLWVPFLSLGVYLAAWCGRVALGFMPKRALQARSGGRMPIEPRRLGRLVTKLAWVALWSGSYTLVDVEVGEVGVQVRVI